MLENSLLDQTSAILQIHTCVVYDVSNFVGILIALKEPNAIKLLLLIQIHTQILIESQFNCHGNNQYYFI